MLGIPGTNVWCVSTDRTDSRTEALLDLQQKLGGTGSSGSRLDYAELRIGRPVEAWAPQMPADKRLGSE
jgi:hypothetical protein